MYNKRIKLISYKLINFWSFKDKFKKKKYLSLDQNCNKRKYFFLKSSNEKKKNTMKNEKNFTY